MSFADSIAKLRARPESEEQRAARALKEAREKSLLDALSAIGDQLPAPVTRIQADSYLHGVFGHIALKAPRVQEWREVTQVLLGLIPPKKTVWYKDGSTSWVPIDALLGEKKSKALESGRATIEASAPFIIRLEKMRQYPSTFSVEWYGVLPGMSEPVGVVLKFGEHNCGTELAGFRQDALYKGEWHKRRGLLYAYVPRFPFVVDQTVYFYGGGLEHGARPTVAWWREELIDSELSVSENWSALTAPK